MIAQRSTWSGRLAFGPWWLLYSGPVRSMPPHAHQAFQIMLHAGRPFVVDADGQPMSGPLVVIDPGRKHAFRDRRDHVLIAYIEPASAIGARLRNRHAHPVDHTESHPVQDIIGALRPDNWSRADEIVRKMVALVCELPSGVPMSLWRHPVIDAALHRLPASTGEGLVDVDVLAAEVGIPSDRLAQLFDAEVCMPLKSYMAWLRLVVATENLAVGASRAAAASVAGFVTEAALSDAFHAMFGMSVEQAVQLGNWLAP